MSEPLASALPPSPAPHAGDGRVVGLSHGAQLAEHPVLGGVAEAMQEDMGQGLTLCVPRVADGAVRITLAQRALMKREGVAAVLTVPLAQDGEVLGALLCERDEGRFTPIDIIAMEDVARTVAPLLRLLHESELSWRQRWQRCWRPCWPCRCRTACRPARGSRAPSSGA